MWIELGWWGTEPNNVAFYEDGRFARVDTSGKVVRLVRRDAQGRIWMSCDDGVFEWHDGKLDLDRALKDWPQRLRPVPVMAGQTNLWCIRRRFIGEVRDEACPPARTGDGIWWDLQYALPPLAFSHRGGIAWIMPDGISPNRGPNEWQLLLENGLLTAPRPFPWQERTFQIGDAVEDRAGWLWVAASYGHHGLFRMSPDGGTFEQYTDVDGLSDNRPNKLFEDRDGGIWVTSDGAGVSVCRPQTFRSVRDTEGLTGGNVVSVSPRSSGGVWLGTWDSGVFSSDGTRAQAAQTPTRQAYTVAEDHTGALWYAGRWGYGLMRFRNGKWEEIHLAKSGDLNGTLVLLSGAAGRIWMGGNYGLGCYEEGQVRLYVLPGFNNQIQPEKTSGEAVLSLALDSTGAPWAGTRSGSVFRFNHGQFEKVFSPSSTNDLHSICAVLMDQSGAAWLARFGFGLTCLRNGSAWHLTAADGAPVSANGLLDDGRGFLWVTSKDGVFRVRFSDLARFEKDRTYRIPWNHFTTRDGLPSLECAGESGQPNICQTADGKVWIATGRGLAVANPDQVHIGAPPTAVINHVQLAGQLGASHPILRDGQFLRHHESAPIRLSVPPGPQTLLIRYSAIDFNDPAQLLFRYRIKNLDAGWVEAGKARLAIYHALPAGEHRFELAAVDQHGRLSPSAALVFNVLPYWWETWRFRAALGLTFGMVLAGLILYRIQSLKQRHLQQEQFSRQLIDREEIERKRLAQEIHDGMGHDLLLLKQSADTGMAGAGSEGRNQRQFEQISALAARALTQAQNIAHHLRPAEIDRLGFKSAVETMLDQWSATTGLRVFKEVEDLGSLLPPDSQMCLYRLLQEALTNVAKHARASRVTIEINREGHNACLKLEDDGAGFDLESAKQSSHAGLGLSGMAERVRLIGGEFHLTSTPGRGTQIRAVVPLA